MGGDGSIDLKVLFITSLSIVLSLGVNDFIKSAFKNLGYRVQSKDVPDEYDGVIILSNFIYVVLVLFFLWILKRFVFTNKK